MSTQKIAVALGAVLLVSGAVAVLVATQPSDEEILRQAVARHVSTMKDVKDFAVHGTVADVLHNDGQVTYLAFGQKDGEWRVQANLREEFEKTMKDPAVQAEVVGRFAERMLQRYRTPIEFSKEFSKFEFVLLHRDALGVPGRFRIGFSYPKIGDRQPRGQYVETFRWIDGRWRSEGPGALFDSVEK